MLSVVSPLYFPKLKKIDEISIGLRSERSDEGKVTSIYSLDWSLQNKIKEEHYIKWRSSTSDMKFPGDLPKEYEEMLGKIIFAIPFHYLQRIRYYAKLGFELWNEKNSFDTNIREMCLKPSISSVEVAFKLIADCIYDKKTNYFYRGDDKVIISRVMLYKFWNHQTGRGLLEDHADFDGMMCWKDRECVKKFIEAIKKFREKLDEAYGLAVDEAPVEGCPSLGEESSPPGKDSYLKITNDSKDFYTSSNSNGVTLFLRGNDDKKENNI